MVPRAGKSKSTRILATSQGSYEVSSKHRIAIPSGEWKYAEDLSVGDTVYVGSTERRLVNITEKQAKTDLYMITFSPDGCVEAFHATKWGIQTLGEPPAGTHDATMCAAGDALQVLASLGVAEITEAELYAAM